jgi:hypothetical protein
MKKKVILKEDMERIIEERLVQEAWSDFSWDEVLGGGDIWGDLEKDLFACVEPLVEKYSERGKDSYEVIDMIYQIMDGMFQRVK